MKTDRDSNPNLLIVRIPGSLTSTTIEPVRLEMDKLLAPNETGLHHWKVLRLDLTAAKMVDSVGLNLLVSILKRVKSRGASLQIAYADPNIERIFAFTRLDQQIELVKS